MGKGWIVVVFQTKEMMEKDNGGGFKIIDGVR